MIECSACMVVKVSGRGGLLLKLRLARGHRGGAALDTGGSYLASRHGRRRRTGAARRHGKDSVHACGRVRTRRGRRRAQVRKVLVEDFQELGANTSDLSLHIRLDHTETAHFSQNWAHVLRASDIG